MEGKLKEQYHVTSKREIRITTPPNDKTENKTK